MNEFLGVPYAQPPINKLRFLPPKPITWDFKETKAVKPLCAQSGVFEGYEISEDCLYLNIYVPEKRSEKFPVMVWFHGGSFIHDFNPEWYRFETSFFYFIENNRNRKAVFMLILK